MVKKKKEDFFNFVSNVLQHSMLTGIPQIASARNWPNRIIRLIVFVTCVAGFIYQSLVFMNLYWEYDVVMDVKVENPLTVQWPSVTVCLGAGFKVQEFCKSKNDPEMIALSERTGAWCLTFQEYYLVDNDTYCTCGKHYCDKSGKPRLLHELNVEALFDLPFDYLKQFLMTPEEVFRFCTLILHPEDANARGHNCKKDHIISLPIFDSEPTIRSCFTLNSLVGRPNYTLDRAPSTARINLIMVQDLDNYPPTSPTPLIALSVHSPHTIKNSFKDGYIMEKGYWYTYRLKKVIKKRLPPPYKTMCKDYMGEWYARGGQGPTNYKECMMECQKNRSLEKHGCILLSIDIPSDEKQCNHRMFDDNVTLEAQECVAKNCAAACYEEEYEVELVSWPYGDMPCENLGKHYETMLTVNIDLNGMETATYIYIPKYNVIETFGYVGGYVGMWLGISLVAVFDFIETLIEMMKYPIKRWARYREQTRKINEIRKFQRSL